MPRTIGRGGNATNMAMAGIERVGAQGIVIGAAGLPTAEFAKQPGQADLRAFRCALQQRGRVRRDERLLETAYEKNSRAT